FEGEVGDGDAEPAHGRGRCPVGVDAVAVDMGVGDRVGPRHVRGRLGGPVGAVPGIGAGVVVEGGLPGDDAGVLHHDVLAIDALGDARTRLRHLLVAPIGGVY